MDKVILDATNQQLGRLASNIATLLQGKDLTNFSRHQVVNRLVEVRNVDQIQLTGNKKALKTYKSHSGYIGHLKLQSYSKVGSRQALHMSIWRMLPKNRLRKLMMKHLTIANTN